MWRLLVLFVLACGHPGPRGSGDDTGAQDDARSGDDNDANGGDDGGGGNGDGGNGDGGGGIGDAGVADATNIVVDAKPDAPVGIITGGPCSSDTAGAAAFRVRWANSNGTAYVQYEVHGLPDKTRQKAGAYGYQIGFTPAYVDPFLAQGGLRLDGSSFVDLELSTIGVASISNATLSIYGRSYNTTASGSFNWQTFDGTGATATNFVSNAAPYQWYSANMTTEISPGDDGVLIRIKAGPNSGSLVVNKIELCMQAN